VPTRSAKLFSVHPLAGVGTNAVAVPAGYTYIVKSATVFNTGGVADTIYVQGVDPVVNIAPFWQAYVLPAGAFVRWDGWVVLAPADYILVLSTTGASLFWMSGTKLLGVA